MKIAVCDDEQNVVADIVGMIVSTRCDFHK